MFRVLTVIVPQRFAVNSFEATRTSDFVRILGCFYCNICLTTFMACSSGIYCFEISLDDSVEGTELEN